MAETVTEIHDAQPARLSQPAALPQPRRSGALLRSRAVLFGAALVGLQTLLIVRSSLFFSRYISASSLPAVVIFLFLPLCIANRAVRNRWPRLAFTSAELAFIFCLLFITAPIPQASVSENVVSIVVMPTYLADSTNHWQSLFLSHAPSWLHIGDRAVAREFYEGLPRGAPVPWRAWLGPLAGWSVFFVLAFAAFAALAAVFYRQWNDRERVNFPLVILPIELIKAGSEESRPIWASALFWIGFLAPAISLALADLHTYFPAVPAGQQIYSYSIGGLVASPWNALNGFTLSAWSVVVGISYFLASDVSLSIWLFHILFWGQLLLMAALGYSASNAGDGSIHDPLQLIYWQEFGGSIVLTIVLLDNVRRSCRREGWPTAAIGVFCAAIIGLVIWALAAGASVLLTLAFLGILCLIVIPLARLVAAGGLYLVDNSFTPQGLLYTLGGTQAGLPDHYLIAGMQTIYGRADMNPAYFTLNAAKVADENQVSSWRSALFFGGAVVLTHVLALFLIISYCYHYGAVRFSCYPLMSNAEQQFEVMVSAIQNPAVPQATAFAWMAGGAAVVAILTALQRRYAGWGLSALGFIVASSWNLREQIWSSVFVGWLASALIRRYGGIKLYRGMQPLFLGLIAGDMVASTLTSVVDMLTGARGAGA